MPGNCGAEVRCFRNLLTGLGKGLIFQLLLHLLKDLWKLEHACVLVVTSLVSIMKDEVHTYTMGVL